MSFESESAFFVEVLRMRRLTPRRVLIVGCGDGTEARHIARATGASVTGLDLRVDPGNAGGGVSLMCGDGRRLPLRAGVFDAIYCYHVLEHIPGPEAAVAEMRRVLAPGGLGFFGTPNRSRLVGYLGGRDKLGLKVLWNLVDWKMRLTGRWSNEQGAHAGFTTRGLAELVGSAFPVVEDVSLPYYLAKYRHIGGVWRALHRSGLSQLVEPSVYVVALPTAR
jgi:SAM-dependent methyltransferase